VTSRIAQCTLDVLDVERMAEFWSAVLGYRVRRDEGDSIHLVPTAGDGPTMWLQPVQQRKAGKLRCHIDLEASNPEEEIERLLSLGARRADVGQTGQEGFEVLSDPEGNEFCMLRAHSPA
jgi:catechol 2,3-dioxygenase-like lactoylglutathione lyase family enzyme